MLKSAGRYIAGWMIMEEVVVVCGLAGECGAEAGQAGGWESPMDDGLKGLRAGSARRLGKYCSLAGGCDDDNALLPAEVDDSALRPV